MIGPPVLPKGSPGYGALCLNHSISNCGVLIDKIALAAPISCFNKEKLLATNHPAFDILQWGDYISLALAGEVINPNFPMYTAVIPMLNILWQNGAFVTDIGNMLTIYLANYPGYPVPLGYEEGFLSTLQHLGFRFSALELTFDFIGNIPFEVEDMTKFIQKGETLYTRDYRESASGPQDSLLTIYDKGSLLTKDSGGCFQLPIGVLYKRLEFRIKQQNGRRWLHIEDLRHNMYSYIESYGENIKRKADKLTDGAIHFQQQGVPTILDRLITTGVYREQFIYDRPGFWDREM